MNATVDFFFAFVFDINSEPAHVFTTSVVLTKKRAFRSNIPETRWPGRGVSTYGRGLVWQPVFCMSTGSVRTRLRLFLRVIAGGSMNPSDLPALTE